MLWVFLVLVNHSWNMIFILSICLCWVCDVSQCSYYMLVFYLCVCLSFVVTPWWSAARTKMIFKTTFMAFFAKCWKSLNCVKFKLCYTYCSFCCLWYSDHLLCVSCWFCTFLTAFECFNHIYCSQLCDSSIWLWQLKSFTIISCSFAIGVVLGMSHPLVFSSIAPTSSLQSVWSHEIEVQFYLPVSHLLSTGIFSMRFLILWSSWSVDSLSPCLMSLYISSIWFQYEVKTSRVSVMALKTFSGSFWASSSIDIGNVFQCLNPSLPR